MTDETEKVTTGITGLDEILGGGLEENKVYLVAGESGAGKTVFALQFIYDGLKKGENAVYVAISEKPEDVMEDAKALGWDLEEYVALKKLIILDMVRFVELGAPMSVRKMMADLEKYIRENHARRLVIDSIDYMALRVAESEREMVTYMRDLVLAAEGNLGCTTVLTAPVVPVGKTESGIVEMAERAVSGVFLIAADERKSRRTLTVRKMRKNGVKLLSYACRIETDVGIVVDHDPLGKETRSVNVGEKIPDFSLLAWHEGKTVTVSASDYRGKWLVMVFYPGDFTFVCPTELIELAKNHKKFGKLGAEILSISMDTILSHQTWTWASPKINTINFPMGADPTGAITQLFGVYSKEGTTRRATLIVSPDGMLAAMEVHDDRIGRSARETLRKLAAARHVTDHPSTMCPAGWVPGKPDIDASSQN
jgi:NADH-dependent peroxiredoxin subunit C